MVKKWLTTQKLPVGIKKFFLQAKNSNSDQNWKTYRAKQEYDPQTGICALIIPQMFADDIGEYTCKATNQHGVGQTSAHVSLLYLYRDLSYKNWNKVMLIKKRFETTSVITRSNESEIVRVIM